MRPISSVRTGVAAVTAAALSALVAAPSPSYAATPPTMTLSTTTGPSGGGNVLTGTVTNLAGGPVVFSYGKYPTVQFQYNSAPYADAAVCRPNVVENAETAGDFTSLTRGAQTVNPDDVRRLSNTKIAFTVPSSPYPATVDGSASTVNAGGLVLVSGQQSAKWNVCVYDGDSPGDSKLIATSTYYLAPRPRITDIAPATSPTYGGQTITVSGAGFGTGTTASIDGFTLTDLRVTGGGSSFTATTPAHSAGTGYQLVVKTIGGLVRSSDPDNNGLPEDADGATPDAPILFTFSDGLGVSPAGAIAGADLYLDIRGVGFNVLNFNANAAPADATAHVFLGQGTYDSSYNRGVQECGEVIVVDDSELLCRLDLAADSLDPSSSGQQVGVPVAPGDYVLTVVSDGSIGAQGVVVGTDAAFSVIAG